MPTLYLIRHGQASIREHHYDRLSDVGRRQASLLGEHARRAGLGFDALWSGTLERQRHTAEHFVAARGDSGVELRTDSAFDEFPAEAAFQVYWPQVAEREPELGDDPMRLVDRPRLLERGLRAVIAAWLHDDEGIGEAAGLENWAVFRERVAAGLWRALEDAPSGARVAVFTSGGVIGAALGEALGLTPARCVDLAWEIYNASITRIAPRRTAPSGLRLLEFNNIAYLEHAGSKELITTR